MPNFIETEFSNQNIIGYAKACLDLSDYIESYVRDGYTNVLMPSRGAYPFYRQAISNMIDISNNLNKIGFISLPYTADYTDGNENPLHSKQIRKFWTQVLVSILNGSNNVYMKYYKYLVDSVTKQNWKKENWDDYYPTINDDTKRFIYIDTVISGSSAYDIISEFELNQLEYRAILIVDENGGRLNSIYKNELESKCDNNGERKVVLIDVPRLFTEDRGPGLGGILGIVYPDLMKLAVNHISTFQNFEIIGSGIWLLNNEIENNPAWYYPRIALESIISHLISIWREFEPEEEKNKILMRWSSYCQENIYQQLMDVFIKNLNYYKILDKQTTETIFLPIFDSLKKQHNNCGVLRFEVSSSHVIRIFFEDKYAKQLISHF